MKKDSIIRCALYVAGALLTSVNQIAYASAMLSDCRPVAQTDSLPDGKVHPIPAWTEFNQDGSIRFSAETTQLFNDAEYRAARYPAVYEAGQVPDLLESADIPFALWTLVNVYLTQPGQVRVIAYKLAAHGIRPQQYLNAFYTYAFTDPEVFHFAKEGGAFLEDPARMEEKLESCRFLAAYTDKYHKEHAGGR